MAFSDKEWREILDLSEAVADLPPDAQLAFLQSASAEEEIIAEVLTLVKTYESDVFDRIGTSIGRFQITGYLGSGGAGDVYTAMDVELQRTVALKLLKASSVEKLGAAERFIREARTVSALNDPHIVMLHEILRSETTIALVMEFVDGRSLRQLCGSPLATEQVIHITGQIAQALAAAHSAGIIHRDIKPENIIVRRDGSVKVLDFGLATSLLSGTDTQDGDSASHRFAGTWRYMSPEQARGEAVTSATDIYSLGLVMKELLNDQPVSKHLTERIQAMLAEEPTRRPSAAQVAEALTALATQQAQTGSRKYKLAFALALVFGSLFALAFLYFWPPSFLPGARRSVSLPVPISVEPGSKSSLTFSPDGKRIAYVWNKPDRLPKIYTQEIDAKTGTASQPSRLTRLEDAETAVAWCPDGTTVALTRVHQGSSASIELLDLRTGAARALTPFENGQLSGWTPDGKWLLTSVRGSVTLISTETAARRSLPVPLSNVTDADPAISAGRHTLVFVRIFGDLNSRLTEVGLDRQMFPSGQIRYLGWPGFSANALARPIWLRNGRDLLFLATLGGVARVWRSNEGAPPELVSYLGENVKNMALSNDGHSLAYIRNLDDTNIWKLDLGGSSGRQNARTEVVASSRMEHRPAISPDGTRLAFESNRGGFTEIWMEDFKTRRIWPLTDLSGVSGSPRWSHDSKWIVFDSRLHEASQILKIPSIGGQPVRLISDRGFTDNLPIWSADDTFLYFASDRSDTSQIWRIPSAGGNPTQITHNGGTDPQVSSDGQFLYYLKNKFVDSDLWRQSLRSGEEVRVARDVIFRCFVAGRDKIFFVTREHPSTLDLWMANADGKRAVKVGNLPTTLVGGMSVSRNEDFLYYSELDRFGDDVILANNFQ